jgi:hypothetical protein
MRICRVLALAFLGPSHRPQYTFASNAPVKKKDMQCINADVISLTTTMNQVSTKAYDGQQRTALLCSGGNSSVGLFVVLTHLQRAKAQSGRTVDAKSCVQVTSSVMEQ